MNRANPVVFLLSAILVACAPLHPQESSALLQGIARDASGKPMAGAQVQIVCITPTRTDSVRLHFQAVADSHGTFQFRDLPAGDYALAVSWHDRFLKHDQLLHLHAGHRLAVLVSVSADQLHIEFHLSEQDTGPAEPQEATSGEKLSSKQVSDLPLNKRDFTKLLALAGGTTTDTNGANNFTLQFAINGQRGTTAVFAMDGVYTTDPELGGATFSNFNVDAIA
ncbi:MAG: carboxypeptidase-like regulatory domain-containing protein [Terriglobia bacterium]